VTELAIVIWRPSRIHAAPSPATMRVWNGDHRSLARRAGMVLRIGFASAAMVVTRASLLGGVSGMWVEGSRARPTTGHGA
jgi:hypothetical protein